MQKLVQMPNPETLAALNEFHEMKANPEKYKRYSSFKDALKEVLHDVRYRSFKSL